MRAGPPADPPLACALSILPSLPGRPASNDERSTGHRRGSDTGGQGHTQRDQGVSKAKRHRRGIRTFAVAAVATAVGASGLATDGVTTFGNRGSAGPSNVGSSSGAYPGNGTRCNGNSQHGNGNSNSELNGQGAAKAQAAHERAGSAAAKWLGHRFRD